MDESPIGKVFIPKNGLDIIGDIRIRYEKHPWIEQFEFDGLHPHAPLREGYGTKEAKSFAESLSKIYAKAYDDYAALCSEELVTAGNGDGLDIDAYFSKATEHFVQAAGRAENLPMVKKFCGFTENMWREGTKRMHDVALKVVLPIIENDPTTKDVFYNHITPEFRKYIEENNYGKKENQL